MKNLAVIFTLIISLIAFSASFVTKAQQDPEQTQELLRIGYIVDDLFIYMHAGPGKQFRILGSVDAGSEIQITENNEDGYTQIRDPKNRLAWVETKYVSAEPGLRFELARMQEQLSSANMAVEQQDTEQANLHSKLDQLTNKNQQLEVQLAELNQQILTTKSTQQEQNFEIKKQWFINGAIVLGVGLLLGLILPKLATPKRKTNSWT